MATQSKAAARRGKPSYFMSIVGVTIVLFFVGIFGWIILNANGYVKALKEDIAVVAYLQKTAQQKDIDSLKAYIQAKPYTKSIQYIDKEAAKQRYLSDGEASFDNIIDENPLPNSLEFHLNSEYVNKDSLEAIRTDLMQRIQVVQMVNFPSELIAKMGSQLRLVLAGLVILAALFCIFSIVLIDNTIRLAMYSNRFLIKTMQMVGATRSFISKPMNIRAGINGAIAAAIATLIILGLIVTFENMNPYLKDLRHNSELVVLFVGLLILGIGITMLSTYRSVLKYLRMKLDELY